MSRFDRFTKALAMANFHEAFKTLVGDDSTVAGRHDCNFTPCHATNCPTRCFCTFFLGAFVCLSG